MYCHSETALLNACRTLFGKDVNLSRDFLRYLQPSGAKSAFRHQAKAHHPDRHIGSSPQIHKQQTERFREIRQAYDLLIDFLEKRHHTRQAPQHSSPSASTYWQRTTAKTDRPRAPQSGKPVIPAIPLEFGMFAFYQGKITYQQLIEALVWQRRQRPTLGAIAQKWGWLTEAKVARVLGHRGRTARFGNKAVELGHLKRHQVETLLQHQRTLQQKIGRYFVEKGLLTELDVDELVQRLQRHNSHVNRRADSRTGHRR